MPEVKGLFSTGNILAARRKYSTSEKLWIAFAETAKVAFFAKMLNSKNVTDPKFRWFEQSLPQNYLTINNSAGYSSSDTTMTVNTSAPARVGMVLKVISTGEQMRITAVPSGTSITVSRAWGTTAAAAIANNAVLAIIGDANAEGASLPEAISLEPVEKFNYTQIFREPVKLTETEAATDLYPDGGDIKTKRMVALEVHKSKIEKAFLFGEPKEDTSGSTPVRASGGLDYFITTNVTNASGALTEAEFESFVETGFSKGEKKVGVLSPLVASAVSYWAKSKLVVYPKDKTYGIDIKEYVSPHGSLKFVTEKILRENSTWNGYSYIVDLDKVGYRYLAGNGINRDTKLRPNRQTAGDDLIAEEYLTECGLFLADEGSHAKLYGVTSYS